MNISATARAKIKRNVTATSANAKKTKSAHVISLARLVAVANIITTINIKTTRKNQHPQSTDTYNDLSIIT
jgi:hypothetical protein